MIIDKNGHIAYHSYQIRDDGFYFIQYDFDGSILLEEKIRDYSQNSMTAKK